MIKRKVNGFFILLSVVTFVITFFAGNAYCLQDQGMSIEGECTCEYVKFRHGEPVGESVKTQESKENLSDSKPSKEQILAIQKKVTAALLCFFLGHFGAHRFYVGKHGTAVLQLLSAGGLGIWSTADLIFILCDEFTNAEGQKLS